MLSAGMNINDFSECEVLWWYNYRNPTSMRLSKEGHHFYTRTLRVPVYLITITTPLVCRTYLQLERVFTTPYYLTHAGKLSVFDEQVCIMLQLHAGNLAQYLDNMQL
jgi:hypothetical protein